MTSGLSLTYALMLTSVIQWVMCSVDRVDNATTSVEWLLFFRQIEREGDGGNRITDLITSKGSIIGGNQAHSWPSQGAVRFDGLCLRYRTPARAQRRRLGRRRRRESRHLRTHRRGQVVAHGRALPHLRL
ncbi:hypothetical protein PF008_g19626, partial [Phytophthora fragariae]